MTARAISIISALVRRSAAALGATALIAGLWLVVAPLTPHIASVASADGGDEGGGGDGGADHDGGGGASSGPGGGDVGGDDHSGLGGADDQGAEDEDEDEDEGE